MATDLSKHSVLAAKYAARLARQTDSKLEILHVVPPEVYVSRPALMSAELQKAELARGHADLHDFTSKIPELRTFRHKETVLCGPSVESIMETAELRGADLLVMGSHGRGGIRKLALGSIAEDVIRRSHRPTVVIGPGSAVQGYGGQKSVLLAVNLPVRSLRAAQYACSIARQSCADVTIVHVLPNGSQQADSAVKSTTRHALLSLLPHDAGLTINIHIEVAHGDVSEEILRIARERRAGLIVIGPREHAVLAHAPSTVLSKIIRKAKCPVLAVTPHIC